MGAHPFLPMTVHVCDAPSDPKGTSLTTAGIDFALAARIAFSMEQEYVRLAAKHPLAQHIADITTTRSTSSTADRGVTWINLRTLYVKEDTSWLEKNRKH
ncbi:peptide hydrolase [Trypanosoma cruzi]|nr:peptide hydrolase [Trypanosoma cruzi]